jgi:hypothetical protein
MSFDALEHAASVANDELWSAEVDVSIPHPIRTPMLIAHAIALNEFSHRGHSRPNLLVSELALSTGVSP